MGVVHGRFEVGFSQKIAGTWDFLAEPRSFRLKRLGRSFSADRAPLWRRSERIWVRAAQLHNLNDMQHVLSGWHAADSIRSWRRLGFELAVRSQHQTSCTPHRSNAQGVRCGHRARPQENM